VNNLGIPLADLPTVYLVSGFFTIFTGPLVGRASDAFGKFKTFVFGCALSIVMVLVYTHLGRVSLFTVIVVTVLMFVGIFSRMIPSQALMSAIPEITKRGSFNAVNASVQQISGGIASVFAGVVVAQTPDGDLQHFDSIGYIVITTTLLSLGLMYFIQKAVAETSPR
jgi:predicted MFS family arabinose efflux permease